MYIRFNFLNILYVCEHLFLVFDVVVHNFIKLLSEKKDK